MQSPMNQPAPPSNSVLSPQSSVLSFRRHPQLERRALSADLPRRAPAQTYPQHRSDRRRQRLARRARRSCSSATIPGSSWSNCRRIAASPGACNAGMRAATGRIRRAAEQRHRSRSRLGGGGGRCLRASPGGRQRRQQNAAVRPARSHPHGGRLLHRSTGGRAIAASGRRTAGSSTARNTSSAPAADRRSTAEPCSIRSGCWTTISSSRWKMSISAGGRSWRAGAVFTRPPLSCTIICRQPAAA